MQSCQRQRNIRINVCVRVCGCVLCPVVGPAQAAIQLCRLFGRLVFTGCSRKLPRGHDVTVAVWHGERPVEVLPVGYAGRHAGLDAQRFLCRPPVRLADRLSAREVTLLVVDTCCWL